MKPRVMVVDDEPLLRKALARDLERAGFATLAAPSGNEASELALREPVDLVITDVRMADGDGLGLLAELQRRQPELPVILITGYAEVSVLEALRRGAEMMFSKPYDRQALRQAATSTLQPRPQRWWAREDASFALCLTAANGTSWRLGSARGPGTCSAKLELESLRLTGEHLPPPHTELCVELIGRGEFSGRISCTGKVVESAGIEEAPTRCEVRLHLQGPEQAHTLAEIINQQRTGGQMVPT